MRKALSVLMGIVIYIGIIAGVKIYADWYFSLPVVKCTPDNEIVAVEKDGQNFGPEYLKENGIDKYHKIWVPYDR